MKIFLCLACGAFLAAAVIFWQERNHWTNRKVWNYVPLRDCLGLTHVSGKRIADSCFDPPKFMLENGTWLLADDPDDPYVPVIEDMQSVWITMNAG